MNLILLLITLYLLVASIVKRKKTTPATPSVFYDLHSPDWVKNAVLYQINIRQYSKQGDFKAVTNDLQRIKDLGIDILWLMPIHPICEDRKKCDENSTTECWGSPYAPYDYEAIDARYGTEADFQKFVDTAHSLDLKVILDFVPNHTGFGSKWIQEHPDWFLHKPDGSIMPVTSDQGEEWADIAQLDLTNAAMREAWMQAHEFWVKKFGIDGYREDCAWAISQDMWLELRQRINKLRPVYFLAEDEVHGKEQFDVCFEANYGWGTHHFLKQIAQKKLPASALYKHTEFIKNTHGVRGWQMNFTQNHDENTWHGAEKDLFGAGADCYTALCYAIEGQPLIYNGQEATLTKRLSFFNKDEIDWSNLSRTAFFKTLNDLKHTNKALWNGRNGGFIHKIETTADDKIYAFQREKDGDKVLCVFNMSDTPLSIDLLGSSFTGNFTNVFTKNKINLTLPIRFDLKAYEFFIFTNL